jgi:3,4-dihydroxy 2-butanone 4-phosphate synthase/GTP cyclohydrolase II
LSDLGIHRIRLLSNTPMHVPALEGFGLEIVEQVPVRVAGCGEKQGTGNGEQGTETLRN